MERNNNKGSVLGIVLVVIVLIGAVIFYFFKKEEIEVQPFENKSTTITITEPQIEVDLRDDQTVWNDDELEAEIENFEMDFSDMSLDDFEW